MSKFKVGDFVNTDTYPEYNEFIVTRVYNDGFIAVTSWDDDWGRLFYETKVMEKFYVLSPLNDDEEYNNMRKDFIRFGYFYIDDEGRVCFDHTERTNKNEEVDKIGFLEGLAVITGIE